MKSANNKILWGLLAFSPGIMFFVFVPFIRSISAKIHAINNTVVFIDYGYDFTIAGSFYCLIVLAIFLAYVNRSENLDKEKKWLWRILLVLGHVIAIPIFWYLHILKESPSKQEDAPGQKTAR